MKRGFKVATAFTGVAALTGIAAPLANAAVVGPGATRVTPGVAEHACSYPIKTDGLILVYLYSHSPACFTGTPGSVPVGGNPAFSEYCDGSATGYLYINKVRHAFTPGAHSLYGQHVSKVQFTGHTKAPACSLIEPPAAKRTG